MHHHDEHVAAVDARLHHHAVRQGLAESPHLAEFRDALGHPMTRRLYDLAATGTPEARAEGAERRTLSLLFCLSLCEHFAAVGKERAGADTEGFGTLQLAEPDPDPETQRVIDGLNHALGYPVSGAARLE